MSLKEWNSSCDSDPLQFILFIAGGEKGFLPDLPTNGSSTGIISATISNGYATQPRGIVPNGLHYVSQSHSLPSYKSHHLGSSAGPQRVVPESLNGFKVDHSYRRISSSQSPDFEYNGGTNRMAKR